MLTFYKAIQYTLIARIPSRLIIITVTIQLEQLIITLVKFNYAQGQQNKILFLYTPLNIIKTNLIINSHLIKQP